MFVSLVFLANRWIFAISIFAFIAFSIVLVINLSKYVKESNFAKTGKASGAKLTGCGTSFFLLLFFTIALAISAPNTEKSVTPEVSPEPNESISTEIVSEIETDTSIVSSAKESSTIESKVESKTESFVLKDYLFIIDDRDNTFHMINCPKIQKEDIPAGKWHAHDDKGYDNEDMISLMEFDGYHVCSECKDLIKPYDPDEFMDTVSEMNQKLDNISNSNSESSSKVESKNDDKSESSSTSSTTNNKDFIEAYKYEIVTSAKLTLDRYISDYQISLAPQKWTIAKFDETDTVIATTDVTYNGVVGKYIFVGTLNIDNGDVKSTTPHYISVHNTVLGDDGYCDDVFNKIANIY